MNKYASGYALIQFLSAVGWVVIVVSALAGVFVGFTAPRDMGWTGLLVAFAGGFQGLLLLGISALGTAVLDGAMYLSDCAKSLKNLESNSKADKDPLASKTSGTSDYSKKWAMSDLTGTPNTDDRLR